MSMLGRIRSSLLSLPRLVRFAHFASDALGLRFASAIFLTPNPAPLSRVGIVAQ